MEYEIEQIVEKCRRGSRSAQLEMYKRYARRVYATCLRIVGRPEEAEEVTQDVFLRIFQKLEAGQPIDNLEGWMRQVAVHLAIDQLRRQAPDWGELPYDLAEPEDGGPDEEEIHYTVEQVRLAVKRLAPGYRVVLSLYLFEGYDMDEIAQILRVKPVSVRSQYMRAKKRLLDEINTSNHG